jgi:RNA polymerase sigma-70 factor (ECF subfamily)
MLAGDPRVPGRSRRSVTHGIVDHFFRHANGRLVAALLRALGPEHLDLAEESVQDAFLQAMKVWPMRGVPDRPEAWLYRTARNRAIDRLRRSARFSERAEAVAADVAPVHPSDAHFPGEVVDDPLRLVFLCCDPVLPRASRVALTLKVAAGFSTREIARAFLTTEATMAQRIVRAKRRLREAGPPFRIPGPAELRERLDAVLDVLYLVFSEGYRPHEGEEAVRRDLTDEAIRLTRLLLEHPAGRAPRVHALLALMLLQSSRLDARLDDDGALIPLPEQDRSRWDRARVDEGLRELERAGRGDELTELHVLAGISACHAMASRPEDTDWERIASLYDELAEAGGGDVVALNRAVAVSYASGPEAGLECLDELADSPVLKEYAFHFAARGDVLRRLDREGEARAAYQEAARLATNGPERRDYERQARGGRSSPGSEHSPGTPHFPR